MNDLSLISGRVRNLDIVLLQSDPEDPAEQGFSFTVNEVRIEGVIRKVTFLEGELLEIAFRTEDGKNIFYAARSNVQRKLWIPSSNCHWTGHIALLKVGAKWLLVPLLICILIVGIVWLLARTEFTLFLWSFFCAILYAGLAFFVIVIQILLYAEAKRTTEVLALFGYDNPAAHDLVQTDREAVMALKRDYPAIVLPHELSTYRF